MGNLLSTQDIAWQALARARGLQIQTRGPPCRGAIVDYCEGRLDARRLFQRCTPLEANEFARLAPGIYMRWILDHAPDIRCEPGRCQFPMDGTHVRGCGFRIQLPPEIKLPDEYFAPACRQSGEPELMDMARSWAGGRSGRHAHASHGRSGRNSHRNYGGYGGHQGHSGHPSHLTPRRQREHQSPHGVHQARPGRSDHRHAPHDWSALGYRR